MMMTKKGQQNFRRKNCKPSRVTELRHFFNTALTTVNVTNQLHFRPISDSIRLLTCAGHDFVE